MAKGQGKWQKRQLRALFDNFTDKNYDAIERRAKLILDKGRTDQFLALLKVIASLQPQKIEGGGFNVKLSWPGKAD